MDAPATVTEALELLADKGFYADFVLEHPTVRCATCGHAHGPSDLIVRQTFRFEGDSDPGDSSIVLAVECARCHERGVIVSAYGAYAEPDLVELLDQLGA